jgi:hypothetical protein
LPQHRVAGEAVVFAARCTRKAVLHFVGFGVVGQFDEASPGHPVQKHGFLDLLPTRGHVGPRGKNGCELAVFCQQGAFMKIHGSTIDTVQSCGFLYPVAC